jgi:endonuclease G, mitochondrial
MTRALLAATAILAAFAIPAFAAESGGNLPGELSGCAAIFDPVGMPSGQDGADEHDFAYANGLTPAPIEAKPPAKVAPNFLYKCYGPGFAVRLNAVTRVPDWVAEDITPDELGSEAERSDNFFPDETVGGYGSQLADYAKSGFDRGHQAPAGDFTADQSMQDQTFVMSNMGPQVGACFNRGIWKDLEAALRGLVKTRQRLIVFTGPVYGGLLRAIGDVVKDKAGVQLAIPDAYFKVVYAPRDKRAMAFLIPNAKQCHESYADPKFQVSIDDLEQTTGFIFFPTLPPRLQTMLKAEPGTAWSW